MQTLAQLQAGQLSGSKHLTLAENLSTFPLEILSLADSLEVLDLSNNQLSSLPAEFAQLTKLKIIFASNNCFEALPEVLGQCANLEMIGFKANQLNQVSPLALPVKLRWLTLTDNQIETLPDTLGQRPYLQKLIVAGNRLTQLPHTLSQASNLELIRISANCLTECPDHLLALPKLAWLAFAGNPFSRSTRSQTQVPMVDSASLTLGEILGQGASGVIYRATWNAPQQGFPADIAIKVFKGHMTSDGYPQDELDACLRVGQHPYLVKPVAHVAQQDKLALVMELIPQHYRNLGLPPSLKSCTRDTFPEGFSLTLTQIDKMVSQMQDIFAHMHAKQVCHGDLYAHNTLFDKEANIIFGDFGAASQYHMLNVEQQRAVKQIEQRALRHFIDDLLSVCAASDQNKARYRQLRQMCRV